MDVLGITIYKRNFFMLWKKSLSLVNRGELLGLGITAKASPRVCACVRVHVRTCFSGPSGKSQRVWSGAKRRRQSDFCWLESLNAWAPRLTGLMQNSCTQWMKSCCTTPHAQLSWCEQQHITPGCVCMCTRERERENENVENHCWWI